MATTDWYGEAEALIQRLAGRWRCATSRRLAMGGDDLAQELWLAALAAERRKSGTWRAAIRHRFSNLTRTEIRRNKHV
jgi:hypothetical protein